MAIEIVVPEVGESVVDARVSRWLKKQGDAVAAGEPLVELETDKVDVEVSSPRDGVLETIAHGEGADVKIGEVLGTVKPGSAGATGPGAAETSTARPKGQAEAPATPSARKLAREHNVDLGAVSTSGPRVTKSDVERSVPRPNGAATAASAAPDSRPASPATMPAPPRVAPGERTETRERMSKRRATIAKRLVEAQQTAAMLTTFNEVDMSAVMALRERQKETFKAAHGVSLGIASFFVKAAVAALQAFPRLNAEIQGDEMVLKHYYDIGVAVAAPEGLVVPVLRDAGRMSFAEVEAAIRIFATRAKDGTLTLEDLRGGTFSITNGGVFGSLMSTPILNPPQVGILGLHAIKDRPVAVDGMVAIRPMMYTALTYDHRIVDGAEAVQFLAHVRQLIEDPGALLIQS